MFPVVLGLAMWVVGAAGGGRGAGCPRAPLPNNLFIGMTQAAVEGRLGEGPGAVTVSGGIGTSHAHCRYERAGLAVTFGPDGKAVSVQRIR